MSEYMPTTDEIREDWVWDAPTPGMRAEAVATFDRWLAEVRREAAEKAWDECARTVRLWDFEAVCDPNPYAQKDAHHD